MTGKLRAMLIIGITGSIGSGKSLASRYFAEAGCVVSDADALARALTEPGGAAMPGIRAEFGEGVIAPDGSLDRAAMRALAFRDPEARTRLETILHPRIIAARAAMLEELAVSERRSGSEITFVSEAALSIEAGLAGEFDHLIVVSAPDESRHARVSARDPHGANNFSRIDATQMAQTEKLRHADWEIVNDGSTEQLRESALTALHELKRRGTTLRQSPAAVLLALLPPPAPDCAHELTWSKNFTSAPEPWMRISLKLSTGGISEITGPAANEAASEAALLNALLRPHAGNSPTADIAAAPPRWEFLPHAPPRSAADARGVVRVTARRGQSAGHEWGNYRREFFLS